MFLLSHRAAPGLYPVMCTASMRLRRLSVRDLVDHDAGREVVATAHVAGELGASDMLQLADWLEGELTPIGRIRALRVSHVARAGSKVTLTLSLEADDGMSYVMHVDTDWGGGEVGGWRSVRAPVARRTARCICESRWRPRDGARPSRSTRAMKRSRG